MCRGEEVHLDTLNRLVAERRVRPSIFLPAWRAAGFALGVATGLMGRTTAMAATVAVETVISAHYNDQVREILRRGWAGAPMGGSGGFGVGVGGGVGVGVGGGVGASGGAAAVGEGGAASEGELLAVFSRHRDEETAHHDTAVAQGARNAPGFAALNAVIQLGCHAAISVAKRA
jgi:ubiquinone biosynthesis monooxygenase Coq7